MNWVGNRVAGKSSIGQTLGGIAHNKLYGVAHDIFLVKAPAPLLVTSPGPPVVARY